MKKFFDLSKTYYYIVDTSYIVFCAAASAFKEYILQEDISKNTMSPEFDPTIDPEFNYILIKKFIQRIETPIKSVTPFVIDKSKIIFSIDCPRKDIWRRDMFPEYKLPRDTADHSKDNFNLGKVFNYVYSNIIPNYCDQYNSMIIGSSCAESDDIIAVLSKRILNENDTNQVVIISSDRDMVQLASDRLIIVTAQCEIRDPKKEFMKLTKTDKLLEDIDANDFLLFKILIGDGSDNIPSVKFRLGPKKAMKYVLDKSRKELKNLLKEDINIVNGFKRNKKLISMKEIPSYVEDMINEDIDEAIKKANDRKSDYKNEIEEIDADKILENMLL